ncbi:MAG TPA: hypothetical protein VFQ35_09675 [Polyangiaceae bacterium]|nr:hypothetical protein [Polyangiaceae bacterium]
MTIRREDAVTALRTVRARLDKLASAQLLDAMVTGQLGQMIAGVDVALSFLVRSAPKLRRAKAERK